VPLGGGLKNWSTNATWFAGDTFMTACGYPWPPLAPPSLLAPLNSSFADGDKGLPLLLQKLPSLQAAGYILHSRWFSNETDYAKQNGGKFHFTVEDDSVAFPGNGASGRCLQRTSVTPLSHLSHTCHTPVAGFALPTDPEFWLALFEEARGWGLMT
jgi:hypothetical protein